MALDINYISTGDTICSNCNQPIMWTDSGLQCGCKVYITASITTGSTYWNPKTYTYPAEHTSHCSKCGKPFIYVGDIIGDPKDYICQCNVKRQWQPYQNYGWTCPQCGKVNAPFVRECDHGQGYKVTCSQE